MDWTRAPRSETPGDLRSALENARLAGVENDRAARRIGLRFELPPDAGPSEFGFFIEEATHLLAFAYLPPAAQLPEGLSPEEALAKATEIAHHGLVSTLDPNTPGLIVAHADLHRLEGQTTLVLEGYGEDPDTVVWWRIEVSGSDFLTSVRGRRGEAFGLGEPWPGSSCPKGMIDERQGDPEGQAVEDQARPDGHATFEEPTGNDAVIARKEETITDEPEFAPKDPVKTERPEESNE